MPDNIFNAAEVIDIGIEKEKKRRDYYLLVAKQFKENDLQELFSQLASWEEEHIKKFTDIRNSVKESEIYESYQGEFEAYVKSLVDDLQYKQVSAANFAAFVKDPISAIRYAMDFERDAILFFGELLRHMGPLNSDKISQLVDEEKKHLIYLAKLRVKFI